MAFNITAETPLIENLTVEAGVESAILKWNASPQPVEIWRGLNDDFDQATLVATTSESTFTDSGLVPSVEVFHWARTVRTLSTGQQVHGSPSLVSSTPRGPEVGPESVDTVHIVQRAVTDRQVYDGGSQVWVQQGRDENNNLVPAGDAHDYAPGAYFVGSGSEVVVHAIARVIESYPIFRHQGAAAGLITCRILDVTDVDEEVEPPTAGVLIDAQTLICYGASYTLFPGATHPATLVFNRDFDVNFVIQTEQNRIYKVQFWFDIENGNLGNFLYMNSDMQQVFWNEFKR